MKHLVFPFCWPHLHQKKKYICVWGFWAKCKPCRNYTLWCAHYKVLVLLLGKFGSLTTSKEWIQVGATKQRVNGSTGAGAEGGRGCCLLCWLQPSRAGKAEGRGHVEERQVICIKMEVPFPGKQLWPQWMLNRGLVASTKVRLSICPFLLILGFFP